MLSVGDAQLDCWTDGLKRSAHAAIDGVWGTQGVGLGLAESSGPKKLEMDYCQGLPSDWPGGRGWPYLLDRTRCGTIVTKRSWKSALSHFQGLSTFHRLSVACAKNCCRTCSPVSMYPRGLCVDSAVTGWGAHVTRVDLPKRRRLSALTSRILCLSSSLLHSYSTQLPRHHAMICTRSPPAEDRIMIG